MFEFIPLSYYAFSGLLNFITSFAVSIFVFFKSPKSRINQTFSIFILIVAGWSLFYFLWLTAEKSYLAEFYLRALMLFVIFMPPAFSHFVLTLLKVNISKKVILGNYLISFLLGFTVYTQLVAKEIVPYLVFPHWPRPGPFFHFHVIHLLVNFIYSFFLMLRSIRHDSGIFRNQVFYVFMGAVIGSISGITNYLPWYRIPIPPFLNPLVSLYVAFLSYAIVKYRLMDIAVVIRKGLVYSLLLSIIAVPVFLAIIISHRATFYSVPPFLAGGLIFACGLWVLLQKPMTITNIMFSLFSSGLCVWLFSSFMIYSTIDPQEALFWGKFVYTGIVYIPAFFYHFCVSFLERKEEKKLILANYLISTVFLFLIPTRYLIDGQYSYFWGYYPKAGPLHSLFLGYFFLVSGLSLHRLYLGYTARQGVDPMGIIKIRYVFWAFVVGYASSIDFAQVYGFEFYPIGYAFVTFWTMIVTYAIAKYQVMDISLIITRGKTLRYAQALVLIPFYIVILILIRAFTGSMEYLLAWILVAAFLIFARLLVNLQKQTEDMIGKVLFREKYDIYETLTEFSKAMASILDLKELTNKIIDTLVRVMGIEKASLFLYEEEKKHFFISAHCGLEKKKAESLIITWKNLFPQWLKERGVIVVREELERDVSKENIKVIVDQMGLIESEVCIPFIIKNRLIGFCNLGQKASKGMFSSDDLNLLTTLAQQAAVALENARLYEEQKKAKKLMRRADRLASLGTLAAGLAHEIRNPLTSIATFAELVPERRNDEEFMSSFCAIARSETERIKALLTELLDYARPTEPKLEETDINEVVEAMVLFIEKGADKKGIRIFTEHEKDLPKVMVDKHQIKQVFLNLLMNAIEAIPSGGEITVITRSLSPRGNMDFVQIEIKDTGIGISEESLDRIFDPFFTTKHNSDTNVGTGLGLAIAHQIVQEHRGSIDVESRIGKGTIFYVNLPVNPLLYERRGKKEGSEEEK